MALAEGVARWASDAGLRDMPIRAAIAFPRRQSSIVLEEPVDEVITSDNAPWWANSIGRVRRLDAAGGARFIEHVLDAGERATATGRIPSARPSQSAGVLGRAEPRLGCALVEDIGQELIGPLVISDKKQVGAVSAHGHGRGAAVQLGMSD